MLRAVGLRLAVDMETAAAGDCEHIMKVQNLCDRQKRHKADLRSAFLQRFKKQSSGKPLLARLSPAQKHSRVMKSKCVCQTDPNQFSCYLMKKIPLGSSIITPIV